MRADEVHALPGFVKQGKPAIPMHKVVKKLGSLRWCGERQAESLHPVTRLSCPARTCQKRPTCWLTPADSLKSRDSHSSPPLLLGAEGRSQKIDGDYLQDTEAVVNVWFHSMGRGGSMCKMGGGAWGTTQMDEIDCRLDVRSWC